MKRLILVLLASGTAALFAQDYPSLLEKDSQVLDQHISRINADSKKAIEDWPAGYLRSLKGLELQMQKAGDLDGLLAIRKERERFADSPEIPEDAVVAAPLQLRDLQLATSTLPADIEMNRCRKIVAAVNKYADILEGLKTALTKKGQIDSAILVNKSIEAVKTKPEFIAAKAAVDPAEDEAPEKHAPANETASEAKPK